MPDETLLAAGPAPPRPWALAAVFAVAGVLHLVRPAGFVRIVPHWLPAPRLLVFASGGVALLGAAGVLAHRTRRAAGWGLLGFLVAVFPANLQMLHDAQAAPAPTAAQVLLWLRLPLQLLLLLWVWRTTIRDGAHGAVSPAPA